MLYFHTKKFRNTKTSFDILMYSFFLTLRYRNVYKTIMFQSGLEMLSRNYSRQIFSLPHTKKLQNVQTNTRMNGIIFTTLL